MLTAKSFQSVFVRMRLALQRFVRGALVTSNLRQVMFPKATRATLKADSCSWGAKRLATRLARRAKRAMPTPVHVEDDEFSLTKAEGEAVVEVLDRIYRVT